MEISTEEMVYLIVFRLTKITNLCSFSVFSIFLVMVEAYRQGKADRETGAPPCKTKLSQTANSHGLLYDSGDPNRGCDNRKGWDGVGDRGRAHMCICG